MENENLDSIFDSLAANAPTEYVPQFEDLPDGAYVEVRPVKTANTQPEVYYRPFNNGGGAYKFKTALMVIGGDKKCDPLKHNKRMIFVEMFVHPGEKEPGNKGPIGGRLTGFLNALFSPGVGDNLEGDARSQTRWQHTLGALRQAAKGGEVTLEGANGDRGVYLASLAALALQDPTTRASVIVKTKRVTKYKAKSGEMVDLERARTEMATFEDATPENREERGIESFVTAKAEEDIPF